VRAAHDRRVPHRSTVADRQGVFPTADQARPRRARHPDGDKDALARQAAVRVPGPRVHLPRHGTSSLLAPLQLSGASTDAVLFMLQEYVPGGDFRTLLNNSGVLKEEHAKFYIGEMFASIDELHKLGYIRASISPDQEPPLREC